LAFRHPVTGAELVFESNPPADFQALAAVVGLSYNPQTKPGGL
jgi:hypothetical protein